jgi:hypothetical protein
MRSSWKPSPSSANHRCCAPGMLRSLLYVLPAGILLTPALFAQYNASIQGTVSDTSGAVIPGATVTLKDNETNKLLTATSNGAGVYNFNSLPPSNFTITATKKGFATKLLNDVTLVPEQANAVNLRLSPGEATQTVTVNGNQIAALQTETASISGTITSNQIQHLPSFGRDVFQLAQLAPGVFGDGAQSGGGGTSSLPGSNRSGSGAADGVFTTENAPQISSNGGQNETNGISINGISTVSAVWGGASVITPNEDSVKDVHIVSNGYDATKGRFSGANIEIVTKNGTNQVHGSAFFKADRPGLNAYQRWNGPLSEQAGSVADRGLLRNSSRFNQFGGSVGGPFWKNHLFGFFAYETVREGTVIPANGWYETPQLDALGKAGSIANSILTFPGEGVNSTSPINSTCASAGLAEGPYCHAISGKGLDIGSPLASALGTHDPSYAEPTRPGFGGGLDGVADIGFFNTLNPTSNIEQQYNGRMDANVDSKDLVTFTIYWVPGSTTDYNGPVRAANLYHHDSLNDAFTGLWNHTFSASLLNEARFNAAGWRWNEIATNPQEPFGLPTISFGQQGAGVSVGSIQLETLGAPGPSVFNQWTYAYEDILTKILGNHTVRAGGNITRLYYLNDPTYSARPAYNFLNIWDFLNDAPNGETGTFNPLTGTPTTNRQDTRDDYKIRPNLTLNLGVRWTYFGPYSSKEGNLSVTEFGSGSSYLTGIHQRIGGNLYNSQKLNFGPQLGFAWSPTQNDGKFVIRGGFGLNYNEEEIAIAGNGANNFPLVSSATICCSTAAGGDPNILYAVPADTHSLFGYPANPALIQQTNSANLPANGSPIQLTGFPANMPTNYVYHYSLDTQYDLGHGLIATVGYQGNITRHLIRQYNANVTALAQGYAFNPSVQQVDYYGNDNNSNYNALLTSLKHQFSRQFQLEGQFAWSKSMDQSSQPYYEDPYPWDPKAAYGRSDFNVTDAFKVFGVWEPVFFHGNHAWLNKVAGGWSLSGIFNAHTGFPWTPVFNTPQLYYQGSGYSQLRPAAYLGGAFHHTGNAAFESGPSPSNENAANANYPGGGTAYFSIPTFTAGPAFPNQGTLVPVSGVQRNSLNGPNYMDADMTATKAFGIPNNKILGESAVVDFRVDAYNVFNQTNLQAVATAIDSPSFGQAQSALGSRTVELQARFSF